MLLCRFCPFMISSSPMSRRGGGRGRGLSLYVFSSFHFPLTTYIPNTILHRLEGGGQATGRMAVFFFFASGFFSSFLFSCLYFILFSLLLFSLPHSSSLYLPSFLPFVLPPSLRSSSNPQCCTYVLQRRSAKKTGSPGGVPG